MPLSPFFLHGSPSERRLVQDLVNEHLQMFGQDVLYLPRKIVNEATVIKEINASRFDDSFRIEAYLTNFEGFGTPSDILTKFGVRATDEIQLVISKERYDDFISPFLELYPEGEIKLTNRPQEGDLIYLPLDNAIFEIKYVEGKVPFYQLNDLFMYELRCEIFEYKDEIIDIADVETGITGEDIIEPLGGSGSAMIINMIPSTAVSAAASIGYATTFTGVKSVQYIDMINDGSYIVTPSVSIANPEKGIPATGTATMVDSGITTVTVTNPGSNHLSIPTITFSPPNRTTASQVKFGNNAYEHTLSTEVENSRLVFPSTIDGRNGRVVISFWYYPVNLSPDPSLGGVLLWSDRIKIYHLTDGKIRFASAQTTTSSSQQMNANAWNFIRIVQVGTDARISVNGVSQGPYANVDPIPFIGNDVLRMGADVAGAGRAPTRTAGYIGVMDHLTVLHTTDTQFRSAVETQVPTTTTEQETDLQTSEVAQHIQTCDNIVPQAVAVMNGLEIGSIFIKESGQGFLNTPLVYITEPDRGRQATAVAIMTSRTGNLTGKGIDRILLTDPGTGYQNPPLVTITGGGGSGGGIATAVINTQVMGPAGIITGGVGYSTTPNIYVQPIFIPSSVGTSTAINNVDAEAVLDVTGSLAQIRYRSAGAGYTFNYPTVDIDPVEDPSFGDYERGTVVEGLESGTKGYVSSWNAPNRQLGITRADGSFVIGESVVGVGVSYTISSIDFDSGDDNGFASNKDIETEADKILDFSERNPFGEF